ncbi:MAG: hypothetical protein A3G87_01705 [Omnitrophica bacterium RIFCSPLOWO2_12_FULL_50_11]|nr:MAG: hypothetical protein A3G87_01705 [Omnitrophica bacterium RIFCSPLOWO2_12_FULL_50_11]
MQARTVIARQQSKRCRSNLEVVRLLRRRCAPPRNDGGFCKGVLLCFVCMFVFLPSNFSAAEMIYKLDGRVTKVEEAERILYVEFKHPATEEVTEKKFKVSETAGFKHIKKLSDLKKGDLVSVDYLDHGEELVAIYIAHIPLKEIAVTTPAEVTKTLLKLRESE